MNDDDGLEFLLNNGEIRWPKSGDRPFTQSAHWRDNASLEKHVGGRLVMLMTGYKQGADLMVEKASKHRGDRDALVFPIVFNYRQFIELSLKFLIAQYGPDVGIQAIWNSHDLGMLWKTLKRVLREYGQSDADQTDRVVAGVIAEFAKVDPYSFSYRYPVDTKGNPIPLEHEQLDLAVLADVMTALDNYFSGCDGYLDSLQRAGP